MRGVVASDFGVLALAVSEHRLDGCPSHKDASTHLDGWEFPPAYRFVGGVPPDSQDVGSFLHGEDIRQFLDCDGALITQAVPFVEDWVIPGPGKRAGLALRILRQPVPGIALTSLRPPYCMEMRFRFLIPIPYGCRVE